MDGVNFHLEHRPMKLAFVSTYDPFDVHVRSGLPFNMRVQFEVQGIACHWIRPDRDLRVKIVEKQFRIRDRLGRHVGRSPTDFTREPAIQKAYAVNAAKQIKTLNPDIIFSPSSIPIAYLECRQPITFWTDATFGGMIDFYPEFTNLSPSVKRAGWTTEDAALRNCTFSMYSSDWAAQTAINLHHAKPETTKVVLRSANVDALPWDQLSQKIKARPRDLCRLFFLGATWKRKGGDIAFEVARQLNERGVPTELVVAGAKPEIPEPHPPWLRSYGYISKSTIEGRSLLRSLFEESHFLIVPSIAECSGIASAEGSAFGLPSLVTRVGGMRSTVHDGVNGMSFDAPASPAAIADYICKTLADRDGYETLAESSYQDFLARLSWPVNIQKVRKLMEEYL